eukprot:scaffold199168_cov32-Tisochrysis_lutea.AAC.4
MFVTIGNMDRGMDAILQFLACWSCEWQRHCTFGVTIDLPKGRSFSRLTDSKIAYFSGREPSAPIALIS